MTQFSKAEMDEMLRGTHSQPSRGALLKKGDFVPEVFFLGQIVGGQDFNVQDDGVFVECFLNSGEDWEMFDGNPLSVPI